MDEPSVAWNGVVLLAMALAWAASVPLGALILRRYRDAVQRGMSASQHTAERLDRRPTPGDRPELAVRTEPARARDGAETGPVFVGARSRRRLAGGAAVAGAAAYGALSAWITHLLAPEDISSVWRGLAMFFVFFWPVVPELWRGASLRWRGAALLTGAYLAVLLLVGGQDGPGFVLLWALWALPPTALYVAAAGGKRRATGPWTFLPLFAGIAALAVAGSMGIELVLQSGAEALSQKLAIVAWGAGGVALCAAGLAAMALPASTTLFRRRWMSDVGLGAELWWVTFTAWSALSWSSSEGAAALLLFAPLVVRLAVVRLVLALGRRREPTAVLLLRVFGDAERSERFLELLADTWRFAGPVRMIGGTDLAEATLEPHELLDYVTGSLSRRFVNSPRDLEEGLASLDDAPYPDGRHAIEELFCDADHWRAAVHGLVQRCEAVVMDLRGFGPEHAGCAWELGQLVDLVPTERLVLVVDEATRAGFLEDTLRTNWQEMATSSPNREGVSREMVLVHTGASRRDLAAVVRRLAAACASGG